MRRSQLVALVGVAVVGLAWFVPTTFAADKDVDISGFAFSPATVTVSVGDMVTWTNNDGVTHTATADGGQFDTGNISGGGSDSTTFDTAGTFAYHCRIHSAMTGRVVVQEASGGGSATPPPTDTAQPMAPSGGAMFVGLAAVFLLATSVIAGSRLARIRRA